MKHTLAIYGVQDRYNAEHPIHVHDHNLCLMLNGKILQYLQLERHTRRKYDNKLNETIEELIDNKIIDFPDDLDIVFVNSFAGNSFTSKNGRLRFECDLPKEITTDLISGECYFQTEKWSGKRINAYLLNHELAHIFSNLPFYGEFKENSLFVHFDGGASLSNFSAFLFLNGKIEILEYHWNLSHLSKFFNDNALAFAIVAAKASEHCAVPGKLMGFASIGKYNTLIANWLRQNNYFKDIWNDFYIFFEKAYSDFGYHKLFIDQHDKFIQDVAAVFQFEFQNQFINKLQELQKQTNTEYLYYAGGCALNILTNTQMVESGIFKDVFIPPCCSDSGLSLGAAAFLEWKRGNKIRKHTGYLNNIGLSENKNTFDKLLITNVAELLLEGKIIGICNNLAEAGPRALGNRSILALANSKALAKKVSMECKQREWYRPIAPVMLEKNVKKVTGLSQIHHLSEYMLLDFNILPEYRTTISGVVHFNNTSRIQTIFSREQNPFIYELLTYLDEFHNVIALINTSFNGKGEPIVHTPEQALHSAINMQLDVIVTNYKLTILK